MKRETSGKTTRAILLYLRRQGREDLFPDIERRFGVKAEDLLNEYNWFSYDLKVELLRYGCEALGDPLMPYHMGLIMSDLGASEAEALLARALLTPENLFRKVVERAPHFTRLGELECREIAEGHAVIAYRVPAPGVPAKEDCLYTHGLLAGLPDLFHRGPSRTRHTECQVRGAPWCVYEVTFPPRRGFGAARERRRWLEEAIGQLEAKHRMLEESQFRLQELTRDLGRQVEDRTRALKEANRRLGDANAFKDQILMTLSHDLRSSLNGIRGLAEVVEAEMPAAAASLVRALSLIRSSSEQCLLMMDDLLDFSSLQEGKLSFHGEAHALGDIVASVEESLGAVADVQKVTLKSRMAPGLPPLLLDRGKITRAVTNLVTNAIKFSPTGGRVDLVLEAEGGRQRLSVIDDGPGVIDEERELIFEKFYQGFASERLSGDGIGLGLFIVRQLVDCHGGEVGVTRTAEGRCCFYLVLGPH